jgi:hypothetical protein
MSNTQSVEQMESSLAAELRAAMAAERAAAEIAAAAEVGPDDDAAEATRMQRHAEARALVGRLPSPPRTFGDIALLAEYAAHRLVNLKTAHAIGVAIPDQVLKRADRVIE